MLLWSFWLGWEWVHEAHRTPSALLHQSQMKDDDECGRNNWREKPKYSEKTYPSGTLPTTNPTWQDQSSNAGGRGGKPATNLHVAVTAWLILKYAVGWPWVSESIPEVFSLFKAWNWVRSPSISLSLSRTHTHRNHGDYTSPPCLPLTGIGQRRQYTNSEHHCKWQSQYSSGLTAPTGAIYISKRAKFC
jgi:hypothetical protein